MHTLSYGLEDGIQFRMHFDGDCTGKAYFTLFDKDGKIISDEPAEIEDVQDSVLLAQRVQSLSIMINDSYFDTQCVSVALADLAGQRIADNLEEFIFKMPLKTILKLEKDLALLASCANDTS